jgi:hypothetical protein
MYVWSRLDPQDVFSKLGYFRPTRESVKPQLLELLITVTELGLVFFGCPWKVYQQRNRNPRSPFKQFPRNTVPLRNYQLLE